MNSVFVFRFRFRFGVVFRFQFRFRFASFDFDFDLCYSFDFDLAVSISISIWQFRFVSFDFDLQVSISIWLFRFDGSFGFVFWNSCQMFESLLRSAYLFIVFITLQNVTFLDECEAPVARRVQWQPNPLKLWPAFEFLSQICRVFQGNCRCHLPSLGIILAIFFILCDLSSSRLSILSANTSVIPKIHFANQICEDSAPNNSFRTTKILLASMNLAGIQCHVR